MNEEALGQEYRRFYVPAGEFRKILPSSDIIIITGQTLVNGTIDDFWLNNSGSTGDRHRSRQAI